MHGWEFSVRAAHPRPFLSLQTWGSPEKPHRLPSVEHSALPPALLNADLSDLVSAHTYQPSTAAWPLARAFSLSLSLSHAPSVRLTSPHVHAGRWAFPHRDSFIY